jgi:hypothetical protein
VLLAVSLATWAAPPITGGAPTTDFPYVVQLAHAGQPGFCSGTLLDRRNVLTAAHCVADGDLEDGVVYFGDDLAADVPTATVAWSTSAFDPGWDAAYVPGGHDFGLVVLATPVDDVAPARVDAGPYADLVGVTATLVGFGVDDGSYDMGGGVKRVGEAPITALGSVDVETDGPSYACSGDSGGPVLVATDDGLALIGVTSYGAGACDFASFAGRYDVGLAWIAENRVDPGNPPDTDDEGEARGCGCGTAGTGGSGVLALGTAMAGLRRRQSTTRNSARRFCAHTVSPVPVAAGRSSPKLTTDSRVDWTPSSPR